MLSRAQVSEVIHIAAVNGAQTERTEALGVTGRNDLLGGHDDQRDGTLELGHGDFQSLFDGLGRRVSPG